VFLPTGQSRSFLEPYGMVVGETQPDHPDYLNAAINGRKLIEASFGRSPTQLHKHTPHALCKSVLDEIVARFPERVARVRSARFRSIEDLSLLSFFYHHYAFQRGQAVRSDCHSALIRNTTSADSLDSLLRQRSFDFFCINDGADSASDREYLELKQRFLRAYFPEPARWEREP
jgi:Stealth protein CR3, conserved region 3/Stealth protein CR4, conserved region 4